MSAAQVRDFAASLPLASDGHLAGPPGERRRLVGGDGGELGGPGGELADGRGGPLGQVVDRLAERLEDRGRGRSPPERRSSRVAPPLGRARGRRPSRTRRRTPRPVGPGEGLVGAGRSALGSSGVGVVGSVMAASSGWRGGANRRTNRRSGHVPKVPAQSSDSGSTSTDHGASTPPSSSATGSSPRRTTFQRQRSARRAM